MSLTELTFTFLKFPFIDSLISSQRDRSGATMTAFFAFSEANAEAIINSTLFVFPDPVGACIIRLFPAYPPAFPISI